MSKHKIHLRGKHHCEKHVLAVGACWKYKQKKMLMGIEDEWAGIPTSEKRPKQMAKRLRQAVDKYTEIANA